MSANASLTSAEINAALATGSSQAHRRLARRCRSRARPPATAARFGHDPADPTDRRDQLGHGVLGGDRVIEQRRVQRPAGLARQHPGRGDDLAHRLEDPLGPVAATQPRPPIGQHRVVEARRSSIAQPGRHLPADPIAQRPRRLTIRQALERLQHHHRRDHISRDRRPTPTRGEQVGEQLVREQLAAMISQERLDAALRHQLAAQRRRVQQLPSSDRSCPAPTQSSPAPPNREHPRADSSTVS